MKYCSKCILPQTHESIYFDEQGVCNICRQAEKKHTDIDWESRGKMLNQVIDKYKNKGYFYAKTLGVYPNSSITSRTFLRVLSLTLVLPLRTRETVAIETPAFSETLYIFM